ncbi:MAG: ATP-dependent DNA helicase RecG [Bacteriovoracaceae bacterium]|nr:ATP-dependent DNA helicase RecG [Bacteriovoracaceae bacterium]
MTKVQVTGLTWTSPLRDLYGKQIPKSCQSLIDAGFAVLSDLLWLFPLKIQKIPTVSTFDNASEGMNFKGHGKIISLQIKPNFWAKGRKGSLLHNITAHVKDLNSDGVMCIKFFNAYPSIKKRLESMNEVQFSGVVTLYQGQKQITNPDIANLEFINPAIAEDSEELLIKYPTINSINGSNVKKVLDRIPADLWDSITETLPDHIITKNNLVSCEHAFKFLHGKDNWSLENEKQARKRIIYHEFFDEQLKIHIRRKRVKTPDAPKIACSKDQFKELSQIFPFSLTEGQINAFRDITQDLSSGHPMMRMVQGDVGCGKTAIAILSALVVLKNGGQVAMMCPTESLALQHYIEIEELLNHRHYKIALILGSTSRKDKLEMQAKLCAGEIDFIIGTHSLIQETVRFKNLQLAIIDEQHKFGVRQRVKLSEKGVGAHTLIMTATPIPRTLSLTQYGDLDITTIETMPTGRKGHKTRIVTNETYKQFLSFLKTRLSMGEQAYIVAPAIEESETQDIVALDSIYKQFSAYFPEYRIQVIHGRLKAEDKTNAFLKFKDHKIDILIATSVVEVGINVHNASVMAIMGPDRFGLSSLHQLRGRVGRGKKPGFCFLVSEKEISKESMHRLMVIEKHTDGFLIAEEDLKIRGEGDLFGIGQSGITTSRKMASIILHSNILNLAKNDVDHLVTSKDSRIIERLDELSSDPLVLSTI